ncbi:MAG: hypothetical protein O7G85_07545, partial [Planctomycetota bacterium]|nr:hypothetical protein [Planctomycetota bacterium]
PGSECRFPPRMSIRIWISWWRVFGNLNANRSSFELIEELLPMTTQHQPNDPEVDTVPELHLEDQSSIRKSFVPFWFKLCLVPLTMIIVCAGGLYWINPKRHYSSSRSYIVDDLGVQALQDWAITVLDNPTTGGRPYGIGAFEITTIPMNIAEINIGPIIYHPNDPSISQQEHILFAGGGGFYHYGLRVGRPGFIPLPDSSYTFEQLGDGVWGQFE